MRNSSFSISQISSFLTFAIYEKKLFRSSKQQCKISTDIYEWAIPLSVEFYGSTDKAQEKQNNNKN